MAKKRTTPLTGAEMIAAERQAVREGRSLYGTGRLQPLRPAVPPIIGSEAMRPPVIPAPMLGMKMGLPSVRTGSEGKLRPKSKR